MTKKKAKKIIVSLNDSIEDVLEEYRANIFKVLIEYFNEEITQKETIERVFDLIYQALEDVYKVTSKKIKENYKRIQPFKIKDILDLTYHADGKKLKDRIVDYFERDLSKQGLFKKIDDLLLNEAKIVKNYVMKGKLGRVGNILVIECNENDCNFGCFQYEGEYPADENVPLPPYHPSCACVPYYFETDDDDDIDDLDLEIEDIK